MSPVYKLHYFNFVGRGEPIRLLFSYGKIPFEDYRIEEIEEWPKVKSTMPLGQVPVLEIDGVRYIQTTAICRYLSNIVGLSKDKTPEENFNIDMIGETINELLITVYSLEYGKNDFEISNAQDNIKTQLPMVLNWLEKGIEKFENGYIGSNTLSWADLFFLAAYEDLRNMVKTDVLVGYPKLQKLKETLLSKDFIREWIQKRPTDTNHPFDIKTEL